jgi:23S rRNA (uracil1939-C5)-methyltransferase
MKKQYTVAPVIKNEKMTVTFEDLTSEGMGVAKVEGYPLFVADGLPGERANIKVTKVGKSFGFARIEERLSSSPDRIPTRDVKGTRVGTMPLQNLALLCPIGIQKEQRRTSDETHCQNA